MKSTNRKIRDRIAMLVAMVTILIYGVSEAMALNDITVRLYDQREIVAGNYTSFCNDKENFLWIGTDAGLIRFDGNHCDIFRNEESDSCSISDNKIVSLFCDSRGNTWVGTVNGLNCFDRATETFRLVTLPGIDLDGYITDIAELPDGKLIFLAGGIGLFSVNIDEVEKGSNRIEAEPFKIGTLNGRDISRFVTQAGSSIICATRGGNVFRFSQGKKLQKIGEVSGNIRFLINEDNRNILISTQYECYRINIETGVYTKLSTEDGRRFKVTDMRAANGKSYVATAAAGIWEIAEDSDFIKPSRSLHSSTLNLSVLKIGSVFMDRHGNLWMGCNHKGVALAPSSNGPFINKSLNSILQELGGEAISMTVAGDNIVLGTNTGNILVVYADGDMKKLSVSPGNPITSLAGGPEGHIFMGVARDGIWDLDLRTLNLKRIFKPEQKYPGVIISVANNGDIIAAFSELGVLRYDPTTNSEKWFYPAIGSNMLSCSYYAGISATLDGKIWIGGYSGIACYDPKTDGLLPIDQTPFLKSVVYDVCDYADGVMIATSKGLVQYSAKDGVIRKSTVADGLPDNEVRTIENDRHGGIWAGSMRGLAYFKDSNSKIQTFGGRYGLSPMPYVFSQAMSGSNEILIGDFENLVTFNPDSVRKSDFGGDVRITALYLNGNRVTEASRSGNMQIVEGTLTHPKAIHLSGKDNSLVVRLSTLDFRNASDLRYEWQFEGDGDAWHSSSPGESLIYLPPLGSGRHKLRLRGWENDVVSDVTELNLNVKAPWYLSNMAYAVYVLILLMMGMLIYKVVRNKREEELYETKIRYFMDISHELRSPVTLMLSPVETLLKQNHSPETISQLLTMRRNGQRVLNLVDQLLDLRKIEKGKMRLVYSDIDIKAFVEELVEMFQPMALEKRQTLSFVCQEKELIGKADGNNLDKILVNLISNAIKYTPEGGKIEVCLKKVTDALDAKKYSVTVTDTGIGLDNKVISHLFERFYRNREFHHGNASGFGIGLDLCTRLVELHKGEISAKNREDGIKGSVFSVTLPLLTSKSDEEVTKIDTKHRNVPILPTAGVPSKSSKSGHRFRILVVDDDLELREYVKECLGSSYKVVTMPDAESALKEISEKLPDLIVSDVRMDGIGGLELLRRIKTNMATQHIPVILFSSAAGKDERVKGWKTGADGYLAKPFTIEELEGMISGLLSTRSKLKGKFSGSQEVTEKIATPKIKGIDEDLMEKINIYINDNLSEATLNVDGLSEYVGISRSQLHRRMKEIVGVAPSDYIRNVKLKKACEMLSQGDVDISQVAYSLGFNAQSHFSTLFKRFTGKTPTEYRMMAKESAEGNEQDKYSNIDKL